MQLAQDDQLHPPLQEPHATNPKYRPGRTQYTDTQNHPDKPSTNWHLSNT